MFYVYADCFHENLFDDLFDPFWNEGALERAMNREARDTFGKRGANMMKTDVKQTDNGYEVDVDLPGCKKEDVQMDLNDGYLTIQAVRSHSNDEKDNKGRYVRRETFSGSCARSFYVGEVKKEDIHAKFEDGVLHIQLPAPQQTKALPENPNLIEDRVNADRVRQGITYIGCPRRAARPSGGIFCVQAFDDGEGRKYLFLPENFIFLPFRGILIRRTQYRPAAALAAAADCARQKKNV